MNLPHVVYCAGYAVAAFYFYSQAEEWISHRGTPSAYEIRSI